MDILCFTETKIDNNVSDSLLSLDGFQFVFRKDVSCYSSGFLIYVASHLNPKRVLPLETILPESLWIEFKDRNRSYLLCNLYRPTHYTVEFWNKVNICFEKALELFLEAHNLIPNGLPKVQLMLNLVNTYVRSQ